MIAVQTEAMLCADGGGERHWAPQTAVSRGPEDGGVGSTSGGVSGHTQAPTRLDDPIWQPLPLLRQASGANVIAISDLGPFALRGAAPTCEPPGTTRTTRGRRQTPSVSPVPPERLLHLFKRLRIQACSTYTGATLHCRFAPRMPPEQTTAQLPPSTAVSAHPWSAVSLCSVRGFSVATRTEKCSDSPHRRSSHAKATTETANAALPSNVFGLVASQRCRPSRLPAIEA